MQKTVAFLLMIRYTLAFLWIILVLSSCSYQRSERIKISPPPSEKDQTSSDKVLEALSDAIRSSPSVAVNYFRRSVFHLNLGKLEEALVDIERAEALKPNVADYLFLKSKILKEQKKYDESLKIAQRVELIDKTLPTLDTHLSELYTFKKDTLNARKLIQSAMQQAPYEVDNYYVFGKYRALKGDTVGAIMNLAQAMKLDRFHKKTYVELLGIYDKIARVDSSIKTTRAAISVFPDDIYFYIKKAENFEKITFYDSATVVYNEVLKINPERFDIFVKIGNIHLKRKSYAPALENYENALEKLNDTSADTYYLAGFCCEKLQRYTEAQNYYQKALTINSKLYAATAALSRVTNVINAAIGY